VRVVVASRVVQTRHETVTCEICGRSLLRGEHATMFRSGAELHPVCELCIQRAFGEGWVREGAPIAGPSQTRTARARSLVSRLRARLEETHATAAGNGDRAGEPAPPERHVHAVPADVHGKLVRAVELFNASEHTKLVAGVIRSLGAPHVTLGPSHEDLVVDVLVAWELCWYRFEADLDGEVVRKRAQGYELTELDGELGTPNAAANVDGGLALAV
jgi:hypothetical protein